jgi:hypothetical protein
VTLARVIHQHWHAVQRDLLYTPRMQTPCPRRHIFTRFTVDEMISVAVHAPTGSAVFHAVNSGYTLTDHLLATMYEHQAGLVRPNTRIERPGVSDVRPSTPANVNDHNSPVKRITFDVMTIDELEARRRARVKGA